MKGFALIEVLVALLILSLGLLGTVGMQLSALQHSQDAYWHSLATTQISSFFECLRVNRTSAAREKEFTRWQKLNTRLLPKGEGKYTCDKKTCTVDMRWMSKKEHYLSITGIP